MIRPFRRRRRYSDAEVMDAVRRSLDRHSMQAPSGDFFTERVMAAVERSELGGDDHAPVHRPRRRGAMLPLMAAAAVVVLLAGLVLAVTQLGGGDDKTPSADSRTVSSEPVQSPTAPPTTPAPSTETKTAIAQSGPSPLTGVKVIDLTFTSDTNGWALASADCLRGTGTCTALMHTTDGHTWISAENPGVDVTGNTTGCPAATCATNIRFADDKIGYVYGPDVLYMTTDGGTHWREQTGGALALESADGNVVRVTSLDPLTVQTADNGSSSWTTHQLDGSYGNVSMARTSNGHVYVLASTAKPGAVRSATLYRSSDDGASWSGGAQPCPRDGSVQTDGEALAAGGGAVSVLCRAPQTAQAELVSSTDNGQSFDPAGGAPQRDGLLARSGDTVLLAMDGLSRSTDGGKTWHDVPGIDPSFVFAGFESDNVARVVTQDGSSNTIWTTHDGGKTWEPVRFR